MANEVKAEVDSLGEEIDFLRERAGVPESELRSAAPSPAPQQVASSKTLNQTADRGSEALSSEALSSEALSAGRSERNASRASLLAPVRGGGSLAKPLPPQGGPANTAQAKDLLEDVRRQVPKLTRALDADIKPALEKTLAEEAALPDGQPVAGVADVSSEFGVRGNPFGGGGYEIHEGIDFVGEVGDIIAASGDGVVTASGPRGGYGITVIIDHGYGYETLYAHMSETKVKKGDRIKRGQIIGYIGSTGRSSGPHLHYSIYKNEKAINPRSLLKLSEK